MLEVGPIGEGKEVNDITIHEGVNIHFIGRKEVRTYKSIDFGTYPGFARIKDSNDDSIYWNATDILSIKHVRYAKVTYWNSEVVNCFVIHYGEEVRKVNFYVNNSSRKI
jgi:hypothetical protein